MTLLGFRRMLETHGLTRQIFDAIKAHLTECGLMLRKGTIVDATLIAAPPSTKNRETARDPDMHQSKKGNQWYFGMKAHIGVDSQSGLVHSLVTTSGNVCDISQTHALLHGEETDVFAGARYQGVEKRPENSETPVQWHVAMKAQRSQGAADQRTGTDDGAIRKAQGQHPGQGRTPLPRGEQPLQASQGPLPGSGKKRGSAVLAFRTGQPGACSSAIAVGRQPSCVLKGQIAEQEPSFRTSVRVLEPAFFAIRNLPSAAIPFRVRRAGEVE